MSDKIEITNMTNMSLDISDIGVKLPGKGSMRVVPIVTAERSSLLREFRHKRWVSCKPHRIPKAMPHWPFHKVQPPSPRISEPSLVNPKVPPSPKVPDFSNDTMSAQPTTPVVSHVDSGGTLGEIRDLLKMLVEKPTSTATPEVIAAHVGVQMAKMMGNPVPGAVHVAGTMDDAPQFIPSKIMPENAEVSIKKNQLEVEKEDFEDAALALRALRKKDA